MVVINKTLRRIRRITNKKRGGCGCSGKWGGGSKRRSRRTRRKKTQYGGNQYASSYAEIIGGHTDPSDPSNIIGGRNI
jgi:hypothetical protein